jgi:hypothetical protein
MPRTRIHEPISPFGLAGGNSTRSARMRSYQRTSSTMSRETADTGWSLDLAPPARPVTASLRQPPIRPLGH